MMSRTPISSTILALSLVLPWNIADDAHGEPSRGTAARGMSSGDRIATRPMRANGARTRSEGLGVRDPSPKTRSAPAAEGAVTIRPMTPVQESAALLMRLPPGKRVVHIAGFAGDITAYGDARAAGAPGAGQFTADVESGLQRGIERVHDRVAHRMKALRAAGGRVDAFTVEHPASLPDGPFGHMVLAEAVDSAVLEVFPRAVAPQRADGSGEGGEGEATAADSEVVADAGDGGGEGSASASEAAAPGTGTAAASNPTSSQARTQVPHWETAMQERGIAWDRIMDDAQQGAQLASSRRSR